MSCLFGPLSSVQGGSVWRITHVGYTDMSGSWSVCFNIQTRKQGLNLPNHIKPIPCHRHAEKQYENYTHTGRHRHDDTRQNV